MGYMGILNIPKAIFYLLKGDYNIKSGVTDHEKEGTTGLDEKIIASFYELLGLYLRSMQPLRIRKNIAQP